MRYLLSSVTIAIAIAIAVAVAIEIAFAITVAIAISIQSPPTTSQCCPAGTGCLRYCCCVGLDDYPLLLTTHQMATASFYWKSAVSSFFAVIVEGPRLQRW